MSRRYRVSAVLNVESQIKRELDIEKVKPKFESVLDVHARNRTLIRLLRDGDKAYSDLAEQLEQCNHGAQKPCRLSICHVCSRENRRIYVADGLKVLGLMPDSERSTCNHFFATIIDHRWVHSWSEFEDFSMQAEGNKLIQGLQEAKLEIERLVGGWDFEWRRWELNNEPPWKQRFWVPHAHIVLKTTLSLPEFRTRLRNQFQRKVIFSVERPTMVKVVTEPFGALSYTRKAIFHQRNISELRPESRHQNPPFLGPAKLRQLCVKLHEEGYKARHLLIGCRLRSGRIVRDD